MKEVSILEIKIIEFHPKLTSDFARLNYEWLEEFFEVEPHDEEMLEAPEEFIINPGGYIFFAKIQEETVGTFALILKNSGVYELAKMAVTKKYQGLGVGRKLMEKAISFGRIIQAKKLYLESNSRLTPAIHLYEKYGFVHKPRNKNTPYQRCDVHMEFIY